jgi:hypothetical protein
MGGTDPEALVGALQDFAQRVVKLRAKVFLPAWIGAVLVALVACVELITGRPPGRSLLEDEPWALLAAVVLPFGAALLVAWGAWRRLIRKEAPRWIGELASRHSVPRAVLEEEARRLY